MHRAREPSRLATVRAYSEAGAPAAAIALRADRRLKFQLAPRVMPLFNAWPFRPATRRENDPNTSTESLIE